MTLAGPLPLSYVYLQETGQRFQPGPGRRVLYDDAAHLLFLVQPASITACHIFKRAVAPQDIEIEEGAPVLEAKASLDGRLLALRRNAAHLELVHRGTGNMFVQGPWKDKSSLLGFFWTQTWGQAAACDLVMVTPGGLELYEVGERATSLRFGGKLSQPVKWWRYAHDTRLAILGTGELGLWLQAFQFTTDGVVKLPPFQIGASTPAAQPAPPAASSLDPADITLLTAYQRVYCAYCDRPARRLLMYRFYKDAVILQHAYDLPGPAVRLAVSDNLLLVHNLATAGVTLLDVCQPGGAPVAAPLPLGVGPPESRGGEPVRASNGGGAGPGPGPRRQRLLRESSGLRFEAPNVVLDTVAGIAHRCQVDVEALSRACGDWPALVAVLQRRRSSAHPGADLRALTLAALREVLAERVALPAARRVFDAAIAPLADAPSAGQNAASPGSGRGHVVVTPAAMVDDVFRWLHAHHAVDAPYLQAAIGEYEAAAAARGVAVPQSLFRFALDLALPAGAAFATLAALATQPGLASPQLAERLDAAAEGGEVALGAGRQLAADLRMRLGLHAQLCADMLAQGRVVAALRLALQRRLESVPPTKFLQAAAWGGDVGVFAAVYRLCRETVQPKLPDFDTVRREYDHLFPAAQQLAAVSGCPACKAGE